MSAMEVIDPRCFSTIRLARLEFALEILESTPLIGFVGATLRGFLGKALHDISLDEKEAPAFGGRSLFYDVFEAPARADGGGTPPYVIHAPTRLHDGLARGDVLTFGLTLFGDATQRAIPLIWAIFRHGLAHGFTQQGRRVLLRDVMTITPTGPVELFHHAKGPVPESWDPAWTWGADGLIATQMPKGGEKARLIELEFVTPLDLQEKKAVVDPLEFQNLVRSLLRNATAHAEQHGGVPLDLDFQGIVAAARSVSIESDASKLIPVKHVSGRQDREITIAGRVGKLRYRGDLNTFSSLLTLGSIMNAGKGRSMGFGGIRWRVVT